jgi:heme exporter protein C
MYSRPTQFLKATAYLTRFFFLTSLVLVSIGFLLGFFYVDADAQQGENYKIIYLHVPSAWICILLYTTLAISSFAYLVWQHPMAMFISKITSLVGIVFTFLTLITGSLWGLPVWGTLWVWDARLTSVLVLFFLYLGYIIFFYSFANPSQGAKVASILAIVGFINIPIVKFSVDWWNTLHQSSSVTQVNSSIHLSMLIPLLLVFSGFLMYSAYCYLILLRWEIISKKNKMHRFPNDKNP